MSDFGTADEFVGVVHAVLSAHGEGCPHASHHAAGGPPERVDLTHGVPAHDVRAGSLTLWRSAPWIVPGVVLAVVDPGVGTGRRAVAVEVAAAGAGLGGPDNGLLLPAAHRLGPVTAAVELHPWPDPRRRGATFDGRDLFAPAAACAALGTPVAELGSPVDPATLLGEPVPGAEVDADGVVAEVLWIDHYGNVQLNATPEDTGPGPVEMPVAAAPGLRLRVVRAYGDIAPDQLALVVDSYGLLSVCAYRAPAAARLGLTPGQSLRLCRLPPDRR
jgi:S-adenosylmethionine hydrolase